ncbi:MAG: hypothetical protein JWR79_979 [Tardiphaga sp.]|nr:hypothetical protein [Tardiphaga sp.]
MNSLTKGAFLPIWRLVASALLDPVVGTIPGYRVNKPLRSSMSRSVIAQWRGSITADWPI